MRPLASALAAALALAGVTGCGSSDKPKPKTILNTAVVERAITASIKQQRNLSATVTCPAKIEQRKGNNFSCFAVVKGKRFEFKVTQTDDKGHVTYVGV